MSRDRDEILAEMHDHFWREVELSGMPAHLVNVYGEPQYKPAAELSHATCKLCEKKIDLHLQYCSEYCEETYERTMSGRDNEQFNSDNSLL